MKLKTEFEWKGEKEGDQNEQADCRQIESNACRRQIVTTNSEWEVPRIKLSRAEIKDGVRAGREKDEDA